MKQKKNIWYLLRGLLFKSPVGINTIVFKFKIKDSTAALELEQHITVSNCFKSLSKVRSVIFMFGYLILSIYIYCAGCDLK